MKCNTHHDSHGRLPEVTLSSSSTARNKVAGTNTNRLLSGNLAIYYEHSIFKTEVPD
ncbi:hypothetical protein [Trichocoleus sp. Lan]|uniref:hypothetical protein n=1 Tax=Trichocoleus sp. Lan TaxID=2933927 RepID=UPI0032974181